MVPLHYIASLEVLSADAREAVRLLQAEERRYSNPSRSPSTAALLDIASSLIEHGIFEQHGHFINEMIANHSHYLFKALRVASDSKKPRASWSFWTIEQERHLLFIHDQFAQKAGAQDLDKKSFYPRLQDLFPVVEKFNSTEKYRNKKGKTIDDFSSDDPKEHKDLENERIKFKNLADRAVDKHLRGLLFTRQSLAMTDHLFGDLLGDSLGHLRPGFKALAPS
ncbi:hypothetical protein EV281_1129 [Rhizobium sp. BK418]|nr:hypothetical protein EV281_1129 [Rhizobium sp. BK418]